MTLIPRPDHTISRANISSHALKVLYRLKNAGYEAYLVGGGVRDLLLQRTPKDFDIATSAHPEEVNRVFRNCRLIGRRFRLAHIYFGHDVIEVATFRASEQAEKRLTNQTGRILHDNVYGTLEEDAQRRDFTVNALYYNIADFSLCDFTSGYAHLQAKQLCLIGDPDMRFREDPVRLLRAIRFAAKLDFLIEQRCVEPIQTMGHLLQDIPAARLFDEVLKLFLHGHALATLQMLQDYQLFEQLFPGATNALTEDTQFVAFLRQAMRNTDQRVQAGKPVTPAFLFAVFLWAGVKQADSADEIQERSELVIKQQQQRVSIPRRITHPMRDIWSMQPRFFQRTGKRPLRLLAHPKFRAAYDFFLLRASIGEVDSSIAQWWTELQEVSDAEKKKRVENPSRARNHGPKPNLES